VAMAAARARSTTDSAQTRVELAVDDVSRRIRSWRVAELGRGALTVSPRLRLGRGRDGIDVVTAAALTCRPDVSLGAVSREASWNPASGITTGTRHGAFGCITAPWPESATPRRDRQGARAPRGGSAGAGRRLRNQPVQDALMVQVALAIGQRETRSGLETERAANAVELAVDREQGVHRALLGHLLERLGHRVADDPRRHVVRAEGDVRSDTVDALRIAERREHVPVGQEDGVGREVRIDRRRQVVPDVVLALVVRRPVRHADEKRETERKDGERWRPREPGPLRLQPAQ